MQLRVIEDVHGELHVVPDPILEYGEEYEARLKSQSRQIDFCLAVVYWFGGVGIIAALGYGLWIVWPTVWSNLVWAWDAGPDYIHWARWALVAGVIAVVWACGVGLWERCTKGRE